MAIEVSKHSPVQELSRFNSRRSGHSVSKWLLSAILLLPACGPSDAASSNTAQPGTADRAKQQYAVAGIAPGMTASAVVAAAQRAGYRMTNEDDGADWRLEMEMATSGKKFGFSTPRTGISDHEFRKGGEMVMVSYVAMPQGPVAWSVHYSAPPAVLDFATASRELTKRYGRSSFANSVASPWAQWCSKPVRTTQDCHKYSFITLSDNRNGVKMYTADEGVRQEQKRLLLNLSGAKPTF